MLHNTASVLSSSTQTHTKVHILCSVRAEETNQAWNKSLTSRASDRRARTGVRPSGLQDWLMTATTMSKEDIDDSIRNASTLRTVFCIHGFQCAAESIIVVPTYFDTCTGTVQQVLLSLFVADCRYESIDLNWLLQSKSSSSSASLCLLTLFLLLSEVKYDEQHLQEHEQLSKQ